MAARNKRGKTKKWSLNYETIYGKKIQKLRRKKMVKKIIYINGIRAEVNVPESWLEE